GLDLYSNGELYRFGPVLYRFGNVVPTLLVFSIGLGLYSIGVLYRFGPVLFWCTLSVWPCTLSVWPALYRCGSYSIGLASTLSVWICTLLVYSIELDLYSIGVLSRFGLYSIGLDLYSIG